MNERTKSQAAGPAVRVATDHETLLVPLDGSPASASVLPIARAAAHLLQVPIHLLHIVTEEVPTEELLDALNLDPADVLGMVLEQAEGAPSDAILRETQAHHTRLIVMAAQGWTSDPRRSVGHVTQDILRRAACSLLLSRPQVARSFTAEGRSLSRILIPLDGTPTTAAALGPASELAARSGAALDVVHVASGGGREPEPGSISVPAYMDYPHHEWPAWQREFAARNLSQFAGCEANFHVAAGEPAEEILRVARARRSDLIVLVWKGNLKGQRAKTVRRMLRDAPCPLLFLRTRPSLGLPPGPVEVRAMPRSQRKGATRSANPGASGV